MNDVDFPVAKVLEGIEAAAAAGLRRSRSTWWSSAASTKQASLPMARYFRGSGHILRFIEYMDVGHTNGWRMDDVVTRARDRRDDQRRNAARAGRRRTTRGEVAERWRYRDGGGEIGVIASVTQAFCRDCTRARLSTEGKLYTCLFATAGHDLRALLRGGASDDEICATRSRRSGAARRPLLRDPHRGDGEAAKRSKCRTSADERSRIRIEIVSLTLACLKPDASRLTAHGNPTAPNHPRHPAADLRRRGAATSAAKCCRRRSRASIR